MKTNVAVHLLECALLQDKEEDPLLHVQHCVPLHDDVHFDGASLLHASRFRGEDCLGVTVILAFSVFMLAIAERMPETSESIHLIGTIITIIRIIHFFIT
jgi:hypothetical protein